MTRSALGSGWTARKAAVLVLLFGLAPARAGAQDVVPPVPAPAAASSAEGAGPAPAPPAAALPGEAATPPLAAASLPAPPAITPPPTPSPPPPLALPALERAWRAPAGGPGERAARVRAAADALGIADVEPVARAFLVDPAAGPALARAEAAVRVAPGLPAAQLALAQAAWRAGGGTGAALAAARRALAALPGHLESLLWLEASVLTLLFAAALAAGFLWIAARGGLAAPHAAHDLADRLDPHLPGFVRAALLAALVLAPAALGEGVLGAVLALFALAWWAGDTRQRRALGAAATLLVLALGPLAGAAGRALAALSADPVVLAVDAAESGFVGPADAARLERAAAAGDPLAVQVLGRRARRLGDLARAEALVTPLLEGTGSSDPRLLNDAGNLKLLEGDTAGAIGLYRRAIDLQPSAELWFNLAQAHMRAIDIEAHEAALEAAQRADAGRTSELTRRLAESGEALVDLPFPALALRARLLDAADPAAGAALRARWAPGVLGRAPWRALLAFAGAAALATLLAHRSAPSRGCLACGARLCARCGLGDPREQRCADCARQQLEARHGGPWERGDRGGSSGIVQLARRAVRVLPGLTDREPARPGWSLAALAALAGAAAFAAGHRGVVPDPAAVGASGPLALSLAAAVLGAAGIAFAIGSRRAERR